MAGIFGLDLGTTNSVATIVQADGSTPPRPLPLVNREDGRPHPSVVWYRGDVPVVGRKARDQMSELGLGVFGDVVRSPKLFLGRTHPVAVDGVPRSASDIVATILEFLRRDALDRKYPGQDFSRAVFTIPVGMDGAARRDLREAAHKAGLRIWQFVHEPLAALYGYLRGRADFWTEADRIEGRLLLVFDWGGGTLDLTLCRCHKAMLVQVLNLGTSEVGGDQFDLRIRSLVRERHQQAHPAADWSRVQPTAEARLLKACEDAKIALTERETTHVFVKDVLAMDGPARDLEVELTRDDLRGVTEDLIRKGLGKIRQLLEKADVDLPSIEFCLATGGMVQMPAVHQGLLEVVGASRLRTVANAATIISEGAAWIAHDGLPLSLAKPLELLHADGAYVPLVKAGTPLPREGGVIQQQFSLYCVDPRDGQAKLHITRPRWPGIEALSEPRIPHGHLPIRVDHHARPFSERLELIVSIDDDLVAAIDAVSALSADRGRVEIWDLEFGLGLFGTHDRRDRVASSDVEGTDGERAEPPVGHAHEAGAVRVRSNVTNQDRAWNLVPGDHVLTNNPYWHHHNLTRQQLEELQYYRPCLECNRTIDAIMREGCDLCARRGMAPSCAEARAREIGRGSVTTDSVWNVPK